VSGNVIFDLESGDAQALVQSVRELLRSSFGFDEPWFVRDLEILRTLVNDDPFTDAPEDDIYEQCITFLPDAPLPWPESPLRSSRNDVEIFARTTTEAFSITRRIAGKSGYATALLERIFKIEVTTRNWNTIRRIVGKFGD
jgi:uncharacterized protein (DUF1697 family)